MEDIRGKIVEIEGKIERLINREEIDLPNIKEEIINYLDDQDERKSRLKSTNNPIYIRCVALTFFLGLRRLIIRKFGLSDDLEKYFPGHDFHDDEVLV